MTVGKVKSPVMAFVVDALKKDRGAAFADIRSAAEKKGLKLYPIVYGRAQALLGIVKSQPRGSGKKAAAKAAARSAAGPVRRGPGRPRKVASLGLPSALKRGPGRPKKFVNPLDTLDTLVDSMRQSQEQRDRYRAALEHAMKVIESVL